MEPVYKLSGKIRDLDVFQDKIVLKPKKGFLSAITKFSEGTKSVLFTSITAIQHKPQSLMTAAYIEFSISGSSEGKAAKGQVNEENAIYYTGKENAKLAEEIINYIEKQKSSSSASMVNVSQSSVSIVDELKKLAELKEQGVLTEEEFQQAKSKLISA